MQVTEKPAEGLSRSYGVRVPATELGALLDARIAEVTPTLNLKGFRPGRVPPGHVRKIYGKALMGEVVEKTLSETSQKVLEERHLRIAARPDLRPISDMAQVIAGREDLAYEMDVEVMPDFDPMDLSTLKLTRLVYEPSGAEVEEALAELVAQNRTYEARKGKTPKAASGDQVLVDFVGRIDGEAFEGGTASDAELVLGSGQFIPGFEEQLIGAAPGNALSVKVTFPEDYSVERLKGCDAEFEVKVKEVRTPKAAKADNALAERLGMADLAALKAALRANIEGEYKSASRFKLKRALLDALDRAHDIALPPRMVETEFDSIWRELEKEKAEGAASPEDEGKSEGELKTEYRRIAERRVRLGLVLAEVGRRENVTVTEAELGDAMRREAMRYGAQAQEIFDFLRQNAEMQNQLRAPVYEEKVVDLIVSRAAVTEKAVSKEELLKEDELPEGYGEEPPPKKAKAAKKDKAKAGAGESAAKPEKPKAAAKTKAASPKIVGPPAPAKKAPTKSAARQRKAKSAED
jgi:trigger factor